MKKLLSPKQVARAVGASEASLKRWCDKGLIDAVRTAGGHRRLPIHAVLKFVRDRGMSLVEPEALGMPATSGKGDACIKRALTSVVDGLVAGDANAVGAACFDLYLAGRSVATICDEVLSAAFMMLGDQWQHGALEVYQERRGVEICAQWLHDLRSILPGAAPDAPYALGGTLERDPYSLATAMAEISLREVGWNAESYGIGHPLETLGAAIRTRRPRLVWVSFSVIDSDDLFIERWQTLYETAMEVGAAVAIGGRALTPEVRRQLSYSTYCDRLTNLVDFVETLSPGRADAGPESRD